MKESVGLFRDFSDERLAALVAGSRVVSFEASEAVAHCGDDARFLVLVLEGELIGLAPGEGGQVEELLRFKTGETFGELGIHPPVRESGDIKDTPGCTIEGVQSNPQD